jgi:hypothetical protein
MGSDLRVHTFRVNECFVEMEFSDGQILMYDPRTMNDDIDCSCGWWPETVVLCPHRQFREAFITISVDDNDDIKITLK